MALFTNLVKQSVPPEKFELSQNYPNPYKTNTIIRYSLPYKVKITLLVNNSEGKVIEKLICKEQAAGVYEFEFFADGLPGGTYFYHLITEDVFKSRDMELIK